MTPLVCTLKKTQHKHKLFGPDFPRTFLTLTPGRPGVKEFLPTTGAAGIIGPYLSWLLQNIPGIQYVMIAAGMV